MSSNNTYQNNEIRFAKEAESIGLTLIGDPDSSAYGSSTKPGSRLYKFNECGHLQNMTTTRVRQYSTKHISIVCMQCVNENLINQANSAGLDYVEYIGNRNHKFKYRSCGHEYTSKSGKSIKFPDCKECAKENHNKTAHENNLEILEYSATKSGCFTYKHKECGHVSEFYPSRVSDKQFACRTCLEETYKREAKEVGLDILSESEKPKKGHRWYSFPCGHVNQMLIYNVRNGDNICKTCNPTHAEKPTKFYFLRFKNSDTGFEFLKFGIAVNVKNRFYGVAKRRYEINEILVTEFPTFSEAAKFERPLHKILSEKRIDRTLIDDALETGHTECYPIELFAEIMELLNPLNSING